MTRFSPASKRQRALMALNRRYMVKTIQKTLDGERTRVEEINVEFPFERKKQNSWLISKLIVGYKNLSLVMAGMYIGLNCYGTPHSHHKKTEGECGPDKRLI